MNTIENLQAKRDRLQAKIQEYCHALETKLTDIIAPYIAKELTYALSASVGSSSVDVLIAMEDKDHNDTRMNLDYNIQKGEIAYRNVCNGTYTLSHPFAIHKLRLALALANFDHKIRNLIKDALEEMKPTIDEYYDANVEYYEAVRERDNRLLYETIQSFQVGDYYMAGTNESCATIYLIKKITPKQVRVEVFCKAIWNNPAYWWKQSSEKIISKEDLARSVLREQFRKTTKPVDLP